MIHKKRETVFSMPSFLWGVPEVAEQVLLRGGMAVLRAMRRRPVRRNFYREIAAFLATFPEVDCGPDGLRYVEAVSGYRHRKITSDEWSIHFRLLHSRPELPATSVGLAEPRPRVVSKKAKSIPIIVYTFSSVNKVEPAKADFLRFASEAYERSKAMNPNDKRTRDGWVRLRSGAPGPIPLKGGRMVSGIVQGIRHAGTQTLVRIFQLDGKVVEVPMDDIEGD